MRRTNLGDALCPIARSLDEIGDWWTLLIVRDAFQGRKRFSEFQKSLGLAKNILSARLKTLVSTGILEKRPGADGNSRDEYHLTEKGRQLRVILVAIRQWGEEYLFADGEQMVVTHDPANRPIGRLRLIDQDGRRLEPEELFVTRGYKSKSRETLPKTSRARKK
jgi:DNA-binding HxlR family transcriptional regulator